jgi:hypothetical protein
MSAIDHEYWTADFAHDFIRTHHATIQQNAEDTKRLRALEMAMDDLVKEWGDDASASPVTCNRLIRKRANEILREDKPHDQD